MGHGAIRATSRSTVWTLTIKRMAMPLNQSCDHPGLGSRIPSDYYELRRDQGQGSGEQVALVTKSGRIRFTAHWYEYLRNTITSANDYLVKQSQLNIGLPNKTSATESQCLRGCQLVRAASQGTGCFSSPTMRGPASVSSRARSVDSPA